ncbi:ABC transporter substrate-binding protein [Pseudomonas sp. LRF_L74]|uniref:ABC transporter substrate-binding protein n=1 Tax=Pseudomonas sp. LRF_L74 TaxID=3369422 RepID=UPI003F605149
MIQPALPDTLWYTRCPVPSALSIALHLGWLEETFAEVGVQVRSLASSSEKATRQAHFDYSQPALFRHGGNGPPLMQLAKGSDIRIIGCSSHRSWRPILSLPESAIRGPADLRGKRLGMPFRDSDSTDFWRAAALRGREGLLAVAGLGEQDVESTPVRTNRSFMDGSSTSKAARASLWDATYMLGHQREEAFALIRGEVDAFYSHGAMAALVSGFLGAHEVVDLGQPGSPIEANNDTPLLLTVSGELLDRHPERVTRWLVQVLRAVDWAREHQQAARAFIAQDAGLMPELVERAYSERIIDQLGIDLSTRHVDLLAAQHDHLLQHGFLGAAVDLQRAIDPAPLAAAQAQLNRTA